MEENDELDIAVRETHRKYDGFKGVAKCIMDLDNLPPGQTVLGSAYWKERKKKLVIPIFSEYDSHHNDTSYLYLECENYFLNKSTPKKNSGWAKLEVHERIVLSYSNREIRKLRNLGEYFSVKKQDCIIVPKSKEKLGNMFESVRRLSKKVKGFDWTVFDEGYWYGTGIYSLSDSEKQKVFDEWNKNGMERKE